MADKFKGDLEGILGRAHVEGLLEEYGTGNPRNSERLVPITQELAKIVSIGHDQSYFDGFTPFSVRRSVGNYLSINQKMIDAEEALRRNRDEIYSEYCKFLNTRLKEARRNIEEELRSKIRDFDKHPKEVRDSLIRAELVEYLYLLIRDVVGEDFRRKLDLSGSEQERRDKYFDEVVKTHPWLKDDKAFMPIKSSEYRRLILADILKGTEGVDKDKLEDKMDETSYKRMTGVVYNEKYIGEAEKEKRVKERYKDKDQFKEQLEDLYVERGLARYEIASLFGVKIETVKKWLQDYDIKREKELKKAA